MIVRLEKLIDRAKLAKNPMPKAKLDEHEEFFKGKIGDFAFDQKDKKLTSALCRYLALHHAANGAYDRPEKGLCLCGKPGNGKTFSMEILSAWGRIELESAIVLEQQFARGGETVFWGYADKFGNRELIVDDIGAKADAKYFGNQGIMTDFLMDRYIKFKRGILTHMTFNLLEADIVKRYGQRIWSRINEMCYIVAVNGPDRRMSRELNRVNNDKKGRMK